jgi:hypothetical protein
MKLIFCTKCHDVIKLRGFKSGKPDPRTCDCGSAGGYYENDGDKVSIWGTAQLIGLLNGFFVPHGPLILKEAGRDAIFWYPENNGKVTRL